MTKIAALLHGLGSHPLALNGIKRRLKKQGFEVYAPYYPSMSVSVAQAVELIRPRLEAIPPESKLYLVTHSMGGIIARLWIARFKPPNLARVVMFAPPNHGTQLADRLKPRPLFRAILGPAFADLSAAPRSLPNRLPPPDFEVGIIAGSRALNPVGCRLLPKPNDGIVPVQSTRLQGMSDHIVVPYSHRMMLSVPSVLERAVHFLQTGQF